MMADHPCARQAAKAKQPRSICKTYTLVEGATKSQVKQVPDLDAAWVTRAPIEFLAFLPQDNTGWYGEGSGGGDDGSTSFTPAEQERGDVVRLCNEDCAKLLRLTFPRFWSHILYNQSLQKFKDTYLRHATRYFDGEWTAAAALGSGGGAASHHAAAAGRNSRVTPPQGEAQLARRVFMILLRMSQPRESATYFMAEAEFGTMIYDQWVWDVPTLLDVAVIYGRANPELTEELATRVFSANAAYADDWVESLQHIASKLQQVATMVSGGLPRTQRIIEYR